MTHEIKKTFRELRISKGKSLSDLYNAGVYSRQNYTKLEAGTANPTIETIIKIAAVLGCEPKELFEACVCSVEKRAEINANGKEKI